MRSTGGGAYLTWMEETSKELRSVRICSHTEGYDNGACTPCESQHFSVTAQGECYDCDKSDLEDAYKEGIKFYCDNLSSGYQGQV